jgi:phenylalanyl-tRNA synthetase beta chain
MKWLREFTSVPWDAHELADRLTLTGVKVETVEAFDGGLSGVVSARVTRTERHPLSAHLFVCQVDTGRTTHQVVCGWSGIAAGQVVAFAPPGAELPKGWKIEAASFAGVRSEGVLCAATEMLLGEPHGEDEGVLVLDDSVELGRDLSEYLGFRDDVLELDLTPNYGYCLSLLGVAGEVAALAHAGLTPPRLPVSESGVDVHDAVAIDLEDPSLCPRYVARVVRGIRVGRSPAWLQARLIASGMRPINNIVDITNHVMLALGQPLHAFDYDRLRGRHIIVHRAGEVQAFKTLDGQDRFLDGDTLVIADDEGTVAIAGVMGGFDSEVTPTTINVLIESARFDPVSIRRTATRLGLRSEASSRFEKGVDPLGQVAAADLAAALMCLYAGGTADKGVVDADQSGFEERVILLRCGRVRQVLGLGMKDAEICECLERLRFRVAQAGAGIFQVTVPSKRVDVEIEIDLVEEIGRLYGFDKIEPTMLRGATVGLKTSHQMARGTSISLMAGLGFEQAITMSFISPRDFERLGAAAPEATAMVLRNPLVEEQSVMRKSLLPGLLNVMAYNAARKNKDLAIFELGKVFLPSGERLPYEPYHLAALASGVPGGRSWEGTSKEADFFYARGALEAFVRGLCGGSVRLSFAPSTQHALHPWRQASVHALVDAREVPLGYVGEISPQVAAAYGLSGRLAVFEIDCEELFRAYPFPRDLHAIPRFPGVGRDIAIIVPDSVPAREVESFLRNQAGELLESIELFDLYRGANIPEGSRSLAFSLVYRSPERTLTDREVDELHETVRREVESTLGAVIR